MKKEMDLKQFIEEMYKKAPFVAMDTIIRDLIELERIENMLNVLWGVELDIKIKPVKREERKFLPKGIVEKLFETQFKQD